jgi:hypothetical protein
MELIRQSVGLVGAYETPLMGPIAALGLRDGLCAAGFEKGTRMSAEGSWCHTDLRPRKQHPARKQLPGGMMTELPSESGSFTHTFSALFPE